MKLNIKKTPKFYWILICFILLLFMGGVYMINHSSSIYEYPKYDGYSFSIFAFSERGSIVNFSTFRINYHFDTGEGTFSFSPSEELHRLVLYFPDPFNIYSVESWQDRSPKSFPFIYENLTENRASIIFLNETEDEWIFVNFKTKLSPNAKVKVWKNSFWGGETHFYFDMGNKFECTRQDCFFNLVNSYVDRSSLGTQQESSSSIRFINQTIGRESSLKHEFEISARSRDALTKRAFWISLGSSTIAGSIFVFFSIIIAIYQELKRKRKN